MKRRTLAVVVVGLVVAPTGSSRSGSAMTLTFPNRSQSDVGAPNLRPDAGLIRTGGSNWHTLTHTDQYGVIVTSPANAKYARRQPGRALMYACGTNMPADGTSAECGVAYADALANNWILKDAGGSPIKYKGSYPVLVDIGNTAYQQRFIADIDADLRTHPGVDGVFIDDVTGSLIGSGTAVSPKYPDNASYRAAMLSFVKAVGPALKAKGWYVSVNASIYDPGAETFAGPSWDGTQFIWWVNQIAAYISGINMEHWQQNWDSAGSVRVSGPAGSQAWDGWQRVVSAVQGLGKEFYAMDQGALTDLKKATYLRASFLLAWKPGGGAFFYTDDYDGKGDPWRLVATPRIGRPVGPTRRVGVGFRRTFTRGAVILNPSGSESQIFAFQRRYLLPDGIATKSVSLPPASGLVLRRAGVR